jgi:hypothetical protein
MGRLRWDGDNEATQFRIMEELQLIEGKQETGNEYETS